MFLSLFICFGYDSKRRSRHGNDPEEDRRIRLNNRHGYRASATARIIKPLVAQADVDVVVVCDWSLKTLKLSLQENCRLLSLAVVVKFSVGGAATVVTVTLPSTAKLLTQVARPPETFIEAPFGNGWLNKVNLSPTWRFVECS